MKKGIKSLLNSIVITMMFSFTVNADDHMDCNNAMTTIDMKMCARQELKEEELKMKAVYQELMLLVDEEGKKLLEAYQTAWVQYSEKKASFTADRFRGGTAAGLSYLNDLINSTKNRTAELREDILYRSEEGVI